MIDDGKLGERNHYCGRIFVGYTKDSEAGLIWRFKRDKVDLGTLGDLMSHVTDLGHFLAGPIEEVVGNKDTFIAQRPIVKKGEGTHYSTRGGTKKGDVTNEDYVGVLVRFANGAYGSFEA